MRNSLGTHHAIAIGIGILLLNACLAAWLAASMSAACDEVGHLTAGLYVYEFGRFDVYRVNPPLLRLLAAMPVAVTDYVAAWGSYGDGPAVRREWQIGQDFIAANADGWFTFFMVARCACLPLTVLGGSMCCMWASALYGRSAGLLALVLWCFCPNVLAWSGIITPDLASAAMGALAGWLFWRWLRRPSWGRTAWAGVGLGLAELTKFTWVLLLVLWPLLWAFWRLTGAGVEVSKNQRVEESQPLRTRSHPPAGQLALILLTGVYLINLGYLFEGSFKRLGQYTFVSRALAGEGADSRDGGNRFSGTWLGAIPVPVPENYLSGIDLQKLDFEKGKLSYLNGERKHGGWWYYYAYAALLKVPLGTQLLLLIAIALSASGWFGRSEVRGQRSEVEDEKSEVGHRTDSSEHSTLNARPLTTWRDIVVLLAPAVAVFALVSSQTGFSRYFRYVLPCLPFVFIYSSQVACVFGGEAGSRGSRVEGQSRWRNRFWLKVLVIGALAWSVCSSLWVYPHSMSYFNELAGGPKGGHRYLVDANIDWGQDMWFLKDWYDQHPEARPFHVDCNTILQPAYYGSNR